MKKKIYWLVQSNGDLSVTGPNLNRVKEIIEADFANEKGNAEFELVSDLQYTITPVLLTMEQYENLGEAN